MLMGSWSLNNNTDMLGTPLIPRVGEAVDGSGLNDTLEGAYVETGSPPNMVGTHGSNGRWGGQGSWGSDSRWDNYL